MNLLQGITPLAWSVGAVGLLPVVHRRLQPKTSANALAVSIGSLAVAGYTSIVVIALRFLAHVSWFEKSMSWCQHVVGHQRVPIWLGIPATFVALGGTRSAVRIIRTWRSLRPSPGPARIVIPTTEIYAYSLPGSEAVTVVSTGLLDVLNNDEQKVVYAHETAHHQFRHDRYMLVGHVGERLVPLLRPLRRRLEFSLERWADETAVEQIGDRRLVAETIAKVALVASPHRLPIAAFVGLGAGARARAILEPHDAQRSLTVCACASATATLLLAAYQVHHVEQLAQALCRL